jgi:ferredoxin
MNENTMSNQSSGTSNWGAFFDESIAADSGKQHLSPVVAERDALPRIVQEAAAPEAEQRAYWAKLRSFFRSGEGGGLPQSGEASALFPLLLAPFRGRQYRHQQFPAWLAESAEGTAFFIPLHRLLQEALEATEAKSDARILKDNLGRLELMILGKLRQADGLFKARPVLEEALEELSARLAVKGAEGEAFAQCLGWFRQSLPSTGLLTPLSAHAPLQVMAHYLECLLPLRRQALRSQITALVGGLESILAVERAKQPESRSPGQLQAGLGFADHLLDFNQMSALLPDGGSQPLPAERLRRIENVLETLRQADDELQESAIVIIAEDGEEDKLGFDFGGHFLHALLRPAALGTACEAAMEAFQQQAAPAARLFRALRMGRLEVANQYLPEIHDDFFAHFDWRAFSDEEIAACPPVLLIADAAKMMGSELSSLSRMLSSGQPVKALLLAGLSSGGQGQAGEALAAAFRPEPGAIAIAHRNLYCFQGTAVHLEVFFNAFQQGFAAPNAALLHLLTPSHQDVDFLGISAAAEGREFPGFTYDCRKGPQWGSRFDIQNNPQPEADWPGHTLEIDNGLGEKQNLEAVFTQADFAAQHPAFAGQFLLVPSRYWNEDLVPLAEYLHLPSTQAYGKVPFIWLVDEAQRLQKAAVSWMLTLVNQQRLDFWHYLQENAGIHSYHVELARQQAQQGAQEEAARRIAALEAAHRGALAAAQAAAARQAMESLADVLLELTPTRHWLTIDSEVFPDVEEAVSPTVGQTAKPAPVAQEEKETTAAPPEVLLPLGEAWIETPLCTSCNECTELNSQIFKYNAEKQAYVADPRGGPFADMVKAAENCPVHIIHPGAPQDPAEPGLEEWIKRAVPYN